MIYLSDNLAAVQKFQNTMLASFAYLYICRTCFLFRVMFFSLINKLSICMYDFLEDHEIVHDCYLVRVCAYRTTILLLLRGHNVQTKRIEMV